ncbi:MAG: hypothetical protein FWD05_01490 [Oscillospiraceae bacterium]|nr:hypothetical protein [Oscillospiraceae bacterium]
MLKLKNLLLILLLRLPFFLLVFTAMLPFTTDLYVLFIILAVFVLLGTLYVIDTRIGRFTLVGWPTVIIGTIIGVVFLLLGMLAVAVAILCLTMNQQDSYSKTGSIIVIVCMFLFMSVVTLFINPTLIHIFIRNLVLALVATVLTNQLQRLERFFNSHYCRGVSSKTIALVFKRGYMMTIACFLCIILVAFIVRPYSSVIDMSDSVLPTSDDVMVYEPEIASGEYEEYADIFNEDAPPVEMRDYMYFIERGSNTQNLVSTIIIFVVIISFIICAILFSKQFRRIRNLFGSYDEDIEEELAYNPEKMVRKRNLLSFLEVNYVVRRLFRRKVREYVADEKLRLQKSDTPMRLADTIGEWEDVVALKQLYHKARYSGEHVKRSELKEMRAKQR